MALNILKTQWYAVACVVMGALTSFAIELDPTRIYLPSEIDALRRAVAAEKCRKDPKCRFSDEPVQRCAVGPESTNSISTFVNVRSDVPRTSCDPFTAEVLWPATGECVTLLTQGPCPEGYWVKIQASDSKPVCEPRPCGDNQALIGNSQCMPLETTVCPQGQTLFNNEFGRGECECNRGTAYHAPTRACYQPYSQGPCPQGQLLKVLDDQGKSTAECVPNLCPEENMVMINENCQVQDIASGGGGTCFHLNTQGPCSSGILAIDDILLEPLCLLETDTHSIIDTPALGKCPRGSKRDSQGLCRRIFNPNFSNVPSTPTRRPGVENGRLCSKGFLLFGGICHRVALRPRRGPRRGPRPTSDSPTPTQSQSPEGFTPTPPQSQSPESVVGESR